MAQRVDELAGLLDEIAVWTTLKEGPEGFRVRAWREAARAVRHLGERALTLDPTALKDVAGLGRSSVEVIEQYRSGVPIGRLEALRSEHPPGVLELLRVPGLGPKLVAALHDVLGISSVADLRAALDDGRLADLPGMGAATLDGLRAALRLDSVDRIPLAEVLEALPGLEVAPAEPEVAGEAAPPWRLAGAARRGEDHLDEVVLVPTADSPDREIPALAVPVRVVEVVPERAGWDLVRATGPPPHLDGLRARASQVGMTLGEEGLRDASGATVAVPTEASLYHTLGLHPVAPERRHVGDAILPLDGPTPPDLVTVADVKGDLHVHSTWSGDGRSPLGEMVAALRRRGLSYAAITDHAENLRINGLSRERMAEQREELRRLRATADLHLLHGAELNIAPDGSVDYDPAFLTDFDWCVASVHGAFRRPAAEQTRRLVTAIRNPAVTAIGHLTGRMLGRRRGIALDLAPVFDALRDTGTALEINCSPRRLDAPAEVVAEAAANGVHFVISTDSHHVDALSNVEHGVRLARRAGLVPEQVVNTWPTERFLGWVADVRSGG